MPSGHSEPTRKGWTQPTLDALDVKRADDGRWLFNLHDESGAACGVVRYADDAPDSRSKMRADSGTTRELWPRPEDVDGPTLHVVEGEPDAVSMLELGYAAVALPGAGKVDPDWARRLAQGRERVVFIADADTVGRTRMRGMAERVASYTAAYVIDPAPGRDDGYDVGDVLLELGPVKARAWLDRLAMAASPYVPEPPPLPVANGRVPVFTSAADVEIRPVRFLWRPWLPLGKVTILAGAPGQGKSQLTAYLAAQTTRAAFFDSDVPEPGTAVLMTAEDDVADTVVPRLLAANADLRRVEFVNMRRTLPHGLTSDGLIKLPGDVDTLHDRLKRGDVRLVVLDPVASFVGREHSTYVNQDVRDVLDPIIALAARYDTAVILVLHLNKSEAKSWAQRIAESHAFQAVARTILALAPDPDDEDGESGADKILAATKLNITRSAARGVGLRVHPVTVYDKAGNPIETSAVQIRGASSIAADDLLGDAVEHNARRDTLDFLLDVLAAGPVESKELQGMAKGANVSWRSVQRYYREICNPAKPAMSRGPWVYSLQERHLPTHTPGVDGGLGDEFGPTAPSAPGVGVENWQTHPPTGDAGGHGALDLEAYRRARDRMLGEPDDDDEGA